MSETFFQFSRRHRNMEILLFFKPFVNTWRRNHCTIGFRTSKTIRKMLRLTYMAKLHLCVRIWIGIIVCYQEACQWLAPSTLCYIYIIYNKRAAGTLNISENAFRTPLFCRYEYRRYDIVLARNMLSYCIWINIMK